jgi:GrpB-like predicted nucleotidyltransferase (UPF0157 family)
MKINIEKYNPEWPNQFRQIKSKLDVILEQLNPRIEHIGSTSVPKLGAKPVIDIAVGIENVDDLDKTTKPMISNQYIYFETFNSLMPHRRLFVGLKDKHGFDNFKSIYSENDVIPHEELNLLRLTHVHIWEFGSSEWIRHIAFRDYLREHPKIRNKYEAIKKQLSSKNWLNGMEYNEGKDSFIKTEESKALTWYMKKIKSN